MEALDPDRPNRRWADRGPTFRSSWGRRRIEIHSHPMRHAGGPHGTEISVDESLVNTANFDADCLCYALIPAVILLIACIPIGSHNSTVHGLTGRPDETYHPWIQ